LSLATIKTGLTISKTYKVRYRAKNIYGWGLYSDITDIKTIKVPAKPEAVTAVITSTNVLFTWTKPVDYGSAVTGYNIQFKKKDGTFVADPSFCVGLLTSPTCTMPMSQLNKSDGLY